MRQPWLIALALPMAGCAAVNPSTGNCTGTTTFTITPAAATADHMATAPGNQAKFAAQLSTTYPAGCAVPAIVTAPYGIWTSSDPLHINIDSTSGSTNGLATCTGPTNGAATLTAMSSSSANALQATATLTCK